MDSSVIAQLTASLMDDLDDDLEARESTISSAAVVVELQNPDGSTAIGFKCTDNRAWFQAAFLEAAARVAHNHD